MEEATQTTLRTRDRLLEAAGEVFADKGYRAATVAEICRKARANVAAVNYHFGSKKKLYAEAWRHEFRKSIGAHPPHGGVPPDAPVEERLRGRIRSVLQRILDPKSRDFDIFHKELAAPTGLLAEVRRESIDPLRQELGGMVVEILGPEATERTVVLCKRSIMSQCIGPMMLERRRKASPLDPGLPPVLDVPVDDLAEHITRFCLAGMRDVRRRLGEDGAGGRAFP